MMETTGQVLAAHVAVTQPLSQDARGWLAKINRDPSSGSR
ncbi:protein of unknown function [Candidatus Methylomirabilis oxygeniifera]|uniref:Uncharacterized protein n=1 Tax=Methylomirabilis oxygeniifera TaxID=671143 RepID=D5MH32_METO1|nr:protein of unknown function [Candidatus Methylomirabilis oxyfera]